MDEKKFAKLVTKLFNKKSPLRKVENILTDGFMLYRGELDKDVFYRLRLEVIDQLEMDLEKPESLFADVEDFPTVDMRLVYSLPNRAEEIDVWELGDREGRKPYIAFNKKYRPLFAQGFETKMKYIDDESLSTSKVYLKTPFGEVIVMPMKLESESIYR